MVLNLQWPGTDGVTLASTMKKDELLADPEILLMVPVDRVGELRKLEASGFAVCVTKPIGRRRLHQVLSRRFGRERGLTGEYTSPAEDLPDPTRGGTVKVLVAEDNPASQVVALGMLRNLGFEASLAENGVEVLEALKREHFDLVLMDVQMPELDGFQTTRAIRSPESELHDPAIVVIAMTAHAMEGDRERCLAAGMNDYITKPMEPETLLGVLRRWLLR